jgi:glutamate racemase
MAIGIFDSGIGGLSILKEVVKLLPERPYFYLADQAYAPYGHRSSDYIIERSVTITEEFRTLDCELVIVACNTATAAAIQYLRENYSLPFVGVEPYINYQNKAGEAGMRMVALMTGATGMSEKYRKLKCQLDPEDRIEDFFCPNLASLVEAAGQQGYTPAITAAMQEDLRPLLGRGFSHAILGCTHYSLITPLIEDFLQLQCISPGPSVALRTGDLLHTLPQEGRRIPASFPCPKNHFWFRSTKNSSPEVAGPWKSWNYQQIERFFYPF